MRKTTCAGSNGGGGGGGSGEAGGGGGSARRHPCREPGSVPSTRPGRGRCRRGRAADRRGRRYLRRGSAISPSTWKSPLAASIKVGAAAMLPAVPRGVTEASGLGARSRNSPSSSRPTFRCALGKPPPSISATTSVSFTERAMTFAASTVEFRRRIGLRRGSRCLSRFGERGHVAEDPRARPAFSPDEEISIRVRDPFGFVRRFHVQHTLSRIVVPFSSSQASPSTPWWATKTRAATPEPSFRPSAPFDPHIVHRRIGFCRHLEGVRFRCSFRTAGAPGGGAEVDPVFEGEAAELQRVVPPPALTPARRCHRCRLWRPPPDRARRRMRAGAAPDPSGAAE